VIAGGWAESSSGIPSSKSPRRKEAAVIGYFDMIPFRGRLQKSFEPMNPQERFLCGNGRAETSIIRET
jgi:hypothetical protein